MKRNIPPSVVDAGHIDFPLLSEISADILLRAGGLEKLQQDIPQLLRDCIDDVIQTPRTGRRSYNELEKTEKTYIGTRVEIMLRAHFNLPKGALDTVIKGHDVDIKHTMGGNWMIPSEALDHVCILVAADKERACCYLGLIVARLDYLTAGANRDAKRSVSADGFRNIVWLINGVEYPKNFWRTVPPDSIERIFAKTSGNGRVKMLFQEVQDRPISRDVIEAVAMQKDFMRRIRADGQRGTRDQLFKGEIVLLSGTYDSDLIETLCLPQCGASEFISHRLSNDEERLAAGRHGFRSQ